jgi:leucyl-tRNA synthetase
VNATYLAKETYDEKDAVTKSILRESVVITVIVMFPFAPHLAEELWSCMGFGKGLLSVSWPSYNPVYLKEDKVEVIVQVNGKVRGKINIPVDSGEAKVREIALADEKVLKHVQGQNVAKVIVVPNKLINIVVR